MEEKVEPGSCADSSARGPCSDCHPRGPEATPEGSSKATAAVCLTTPPASLSPSRCRDPAPINSILGSFHFQRAKRVGRLGPWFAAFGKPAPPGPQVLGCP